jgi:hypothetical protein
MREGRSHEQYPTDAAMQPAARKFSAANAGEMTTPGAYFPISALRLRTAMPVLV